MNAPVPSGGSEFAGRGLHPLESAAFARRTSIIESLPASIYGPLHFGTGLGLEAAKRPRDIAHMDDN
jgi:hypothetical protein